MAGNKIGGMKSAAKIKQRNPTFYADIGKIGGQNGKGEGYKGGFAADTKCQCEFDNFGHFKRECAGAKGGAMRRRKKVEKAA